MADAVVGCDRPQRLAGVVPCADRCLVLGADLGSCRHAAQPTREGCQARRTAQLAAPQRRSWQPSPALATINRHEAETHLDHKETGPAAARSTSPGRFVHASQNVSTTFDPNRTQTASQSQKLPDSARKRIDRM